MKGDCWVTAEGLGVETCWTAWETCCVWAAEIQPLAPSEPRVTKWDLVYISEADSVSKFVCTVTPFSYFPSCHLYHCTPRSPFQIYCSSLQDQIMCFITLSAQIHRRSRGRGKGSVAISTQICPGSREKAKGSAVAEEGCASGTWPTCAFSTGSSELEVTSC